MVDGEFYVCATGSIEYGEFYEIDNAYCKYGYHYGSEWNIVGVRKILFVFFRFLLMCIRNFV